MLQAQLIAFGVALVCSLSLTPVFIWLSHRFGVLDQPNDRKVHSRATPRWGGGAIACAVLLGVGTALFQAPAFHRLLSFKHRLVEAGEVVGILSIKSQLIGLLMGGTVCVLVGMWDDRKPLPSLVKLLAQVIAAYVAMMYGIRISGLALPHWGVVPFPLGFSQILTLLWLLGFMNTINLADGLDGLASGIVAIAAGTFLFVAILQSDVPSGFQARQLKLASVLAAATAGGGLGFLVYNFYPARVFMGDGGALFLGFMLGSISIIGTLKSSAVISFLIPVLVIAFPVTDVAFAMIRRYRKGRGLMTADRDHFHHRFLALGWTQREVVLLIYVITLLLSITALLLTFFRG